MTKFKYDATTTSGKRARGVTEATSVRSAMAVLVDEGLDVRQIKEKQSVLQVRGHSEEAQVGRADALLAAARGVRPRGDPARRSAPDHRGRVRGQDASQGPGGGPGIARRRRHLLGRAHALRNALPAVLHRHDPGRGTDRSSRRCAGRTVALHQARPRGAQQGEVGADLPGGHPALLDRHRGRAVRVRASAIQGVLRVAARDPAAADPHADRLHGLPPPLLVGDLDRVRPGRLRALAPRTHRGRPPSCATSSCSRCR